jgi:hypothetical protein
MIFPPDEPTGGYYFPLLALCLWHLACWSANYSHKDCLTDVRFA